MNKQIPHKRPSRQTTSDVWSQYLQRRIMRLLLLHDQQLFRKQFQTFFTGSSLPRLPLLQFYDQHLKLLMFSKELLEDILPRIRRQLSLQTEQVVQQEEAPTRGEIDWQSTMTRVLNETPGQPPLRFDTRQRQQHMNVPENLLFIALLLHHQHVIQNTLKQDQRDELLTAQERQQLTAIAEQIAGELIAPYARPLVEEASQSDIEKLAEQVTTQLRPGVSPYRDLLTWWEHFNALHLGQSNANRQQALTDKHRNEQMDGEYYALWLALEILTLLQEKHLIRPDSMEIQIDHMHCTFTWEQQHYHFHYQRRLAPPSGIMSGWEQVPAVQYGYTIEREQALEITHADTLIWREPPFIMNAAYATGTNTTAHLGVAIQEILGSMQLRYAHAGALFFPLTSAPDTDKQVTNEIKHDKHMYANGAVRDTSITYYQITPAISTHLLQEQLLIALQHAVACLPKRETPACHGVVLDPASVNASQSTQPPYEILCPKPHIGRGIFDLVSREKHCLKDPRLCHVIGQAILPPIVQRVNNLDDLKLHVHELRTYGETALKQAEKDGNDDKAEDLRTQILYTVGHMIEQYASKHDTTGSEKYLGAVFKMYWEYSERCLAEETRHILISGEYVWGEYVGAKLKDWAAPCIQYCRALERELKKRLGTWTLGQYRYIYKNKNHDKKALADWNNLLKTCRESGTSENDFSEFIERMVNTDIANLRNKLAHGEQIDKQTAEKIRLAVLGEVRRNEPGILNWVVEHLNVKN